MRGGDLIGARAAGRVERAGDDECRGGHLAKAVVEWLHRALPGAAQARGETGGPVAKARGVEPGDPGRRHRGMAREDGFALPFGDEGLDAVALEAAGASLVRGGARGASGRVRDARGRALEHEPAHRTRVRDGESKGDPRARASSRGREPAQAANRSQDRREVVGGPLDAGPPRVAGLPDRPCPGRSTTTTRNRRRECRRVRAPARAAAGEAVEQQQRDAGPADADLPAQAVDLDSAHPGARAAATAAAASRWRIDVAGTVRPIAQDPDAGRADRVGQRRRACRPS